MADIDSQLPVKDTADGSTGSAVPTVAQLVAGSDGTNLRAISTDSAGKVNVTFSNVTLAVTGTFFQATQPVSGTFWQATQPVSGPLTDTQLRATAVPVSGTFFQATQPISAAALPLPSGASTSALQTIGNTSVASIDTKTPALGQALAAASTPVVLTAAQLTTLTPLTSVTVTQATGTNLHAVVDSSALPTGAATSALQTTGNTSLSSIDGKLSTKSGALAANQISNGSGTQAAITIGTTAVLVNVSGTNLANRISATLCNNSLTIWYWGYTNAVTTSTGTPIQPNQVVAWDVGPSTNVYAISGSASQNGRVTEAAN